jgi:S-adenosylmethionine/arginine decarboxylase-like enzyme
MATKTSLGELVALQRNAKPSASKSDADDSSPPAVELDDHGGVRPVPEEKESHWGYHLIVDASGCNKAVDDPDEVANYLKEMVKALKMKAVGDPIICQFTNPRGRGTSGVQIITESSITFHSDDEKWQAYIDVFSCKTFEPKVALDLTMKCFAPKHMGKLWLHRDAGPWPER